MLILNNLVGFGAGGVTTSLSFLQGSVSGDDSATYTFSSQNLGAADPNRWIVVCATGIQNAARTIDAVTVGGVSATKIVEAEASAYRSVSIWVAYVPTGTTGDIVLTFSSGLVRAGYSAYRLITETNPTTAYDTETDTTTSGSDLSVSINRPGGGVVIAATVAVCSTATSVTWSGTSENYDAAYPDAAAQGMSSSSVASGASPLTVTATISGTLVAGSQALAAASFY